VNDNLVCPDCGRGVYKQIQNGKWHTLDRVTNNSHWITCHPGPLKFKVYDELIVWWPKSVATYVVCKILEDEGTYQLQEHFTDEYGLVKKITFNKLEHIAKRMDKIYEFLYF
jgi:hypothetical protein